MNLVDEQHIARFQVGQQGGDIARLFQHRAGGGAQGNTHLIGDNARQGGLAKAGRSKNQRVIQRFTAPLCRLQEDRHLVAHSGLTHVLLETLRANGPVHGVLGGRIGFGCYQAVSFNHGLLSR